MKEIETIIKYNSVDNLKYREIKANIDSFINSPEKIKFSLNSIAMLLALDKQIQQDEYTIIEAYGNNARLYGKNGFIMSKDDASENYDIINASNNELWLPFYQSKTKAYLLGETRTTVPKIDSLETNFELKNSIPKEGFFMINNNQFKTLNFKGECYQLHDLIIEDNNIKYLNLARIKDHTK